MPIETGNTLLSPPRLTGDPDRDRLAINRWMQDLYNSLVLSANITGTLTDHEARITALEAQYVALDARVTALE
ncbi:hypothetical protein UFOVP469_4 [uncultured Caudovirales phage]|uniref:Uncharacterized protein n=1 Tax=uncultured Caudovirales phage TaxID=2100421 RepID=A0A6J5QZL5_9CAUD|nr:hypothetical protein UFOVP469_4 [uncultured Caudovirales phage]CAB4190069.1 hypothetical protein UFOVP1200_34 [uncultured Caudovirales phage]